MAVKEMGKNGPWKIGAGAGAIILGIYLLFNRQSFSEVIFGAAIVGFGIWLLASSLK